MLGSMIPKLGMFMPQLLAATAALTIVGKGVSVLVEKQREHTAQVVASMTTSADAVSLFGGSLTQAGQVMYNFETQAETTEKKLTQIQKTLAEIKKLDDTNPLKLVAESLKGMDTASSVVGTLKTFVSAQVASGMDPALAKGMVESLLAYSNQSQYLAVAQKEIAKATTDVDTATRTWLSKLSNANTSVIGAGAAYKNLSGTQKAYGDALLQVTNNISSSSTPFKQFIGQLEAMSSKGANSTNAINALAAALGQVDMKASAAVTNYGKIGMNMTQIQWLLKLSAQGEKINPNATKSDLEKTVLSQTKIEGVIKNQAASSIAAAQATLDQAKASAKLAGIQGSGDSSKIKALKAQKDLVDAQLKSLTKQTQEIEKQQKFRISQADLDNQIRMAQAGGNFLQSAQLQQQKFYNQEEFQKTNETDKLGQKSAALGEQIAFLQEAASAAKSAATSAASIKSAQEQVKAAQAALLAAQAENTPAKIKETVISILASLGVKVGQSVPPGSQGTSFGPKDVKVVTGKNLGEAAKNAVGGKQQSQRWEDPAGGIWTKFKFNNKDYIVSQDETTLYAFDPIKNDKIGKRLKPGSVTGRAVGGPTFKDQMYMVGEKGPEFFVPSQNGSIIPNDISRGMMNQSSNTTNEYALNLTFNGTDMNPDDVARKVMDAIKRAGNSNSVYTNRRIET
jgi:hypothetical protein